VLNGAVVFPIFGALYYWVPKMTGRMLYERLGKFSFWTMFVGFNAAFFPMHVLGLLGMPRRIYTYPDGLGWAGLNALVTIGSFVFAAGTGLTLWNLIWSWRRGQPAPPNPWDADTLEWSTTSPPPEWNFEKVPVIGSRHPLWDEGGLTYAESGTDAATVSLGPPGARARQTPVGTAVDALPEATMSIPEESYLPFLVALGIAIVFVGLLVEAALVGILGLAVGAFAITRWAWRTEADLR
jgi:cytochrome c oxidase subunit 1/cytochrome c oxidase subunit I+III